MSSSALMYAFLTAAGADVRVHIPHRVEEGYGPSVQAVEDHKAAGVKLLVTLDCGVMAHDPLLRAGELGMDTVIVDHHQAGEDLPVAEAVINPNRLDDTSGQGALCAAGVAMVLVAATVKVLREAGWWSADRPEPDMLAMLDLVALATVCDVVPLTGLNRAYVRQGLKVMGSRGRPGLAALADAARLSRPPDAHALGFVLGPRLNAAGRIGSAMDGFALLTSSDRGQAAQLAQSLEEMNKKRQAIELATVDRAVQQAEEMLGSKQRSRFWWWPARVGTPVFWGLLPRASRSASTSLPSRLACQGWLARNGFGALDFRCQPGRCGACRCRGGCGGQGRRPRHGGRHHRGTFTHCSLARLP
jgi:single-stranded-DNA-specific exonuclease